MPVNYRRLLHIMVNVSIEMNKLQILQIQKYTLLKVRFDDLPGV